MGKFVRCRVRDATYGELVGQDVRVGSRLERRWVDMAARGAYAQESAPKTEPLSIRTTPSATLNEAAPRVGHEKGEERVGVRRRAGRWV